MPMGNGEVSKDKMSGGSVDADFAANCRYTEHTQFPHHAKMDHKKEAGVHHHDKGYHGMHTKHDY